MTEDPQLDIEHSLSKNMSLKKWLEGLILQVIVNPKHMLFHEQTFYPTHRPDHQSVLSSHLANVWLPGKNFVVDRLIRSY